MKKLIIQIPCFNEELTIQATLKDLPTKLQGIDSIEVLIIDDGSTDNTVSVAKSFGVQHVLSLTTNRGLGVAFSFGLEKCLELDADIIVNTDGDNQYFGEDIAKLITPILNNEADIVVGARPISCHEEFSFLKKKLQYIGSYVVRFVSNTSVKDAPSGFRAISAEAARKIHIFGKYTYTIEMIIQSGLKGFSIISVPVRVNPSLRPSRLMRSIPEYILKSFLTICDVCLLYSSRKFFTFLSVLLLLSSFLIGLRFLFFYFSDGGQGKIQSLILMSILFGAGGSLLIAGIIANLISTNRSFLEKIYEKLSDLELKIKKLEKQLKE